MLSSADKHDVDDVSKSGPEMLLETLGYKKRCNIEFENPYDCIGDGGSHRI
jgi:hypothetical protein